MEILFRGRRIDTGEWVYGYYCFNPFFKRGEIFAFDDDRSYVYEVDPKTVGQYIGLTDRKNKKIFSGQLIKFQDWGKKDRVMGIKYNEDMCRFVFFDPAKDPDLWKGIEKGYSMEIVGDIF